MANLSWPSNSKRGGSWEYDILKFSSLQRKLGITDSDDDSILFHPLLFEDSSVDRSCCREQKQKNAIELRCDMHSEMAVVITCMCLSGIRLHTKLDKRLY